MPRGTASGGRDLARGSVTVAWLIVIGAILHPPQGLGLRLCWFERALGVPCPGCGLSRGVSCAVRGMFAEAWAAHPFGPIVLAIAIVVALSVFLPAPVRAKLEATIARHDRVRTVFVAILVAAFMVHGIARAILCLRGG